MLFNSVDIPAWLDINGITPALRTKSMRKMLWGGDTETKEGPPISFQFYNPQRKQHIWIDDPEFATDVFLTWCESLHSKTMHVVYIHNLAFDLVSLFWDARDEFLQTTSGEYEFAAESPSGTVWEIAGTYGAPTYCTLVDEHRTRTIYLVDSASYYQASLAKAAEQFCPHLPKLKMPKGLGKKDFAHDDEEFLAYAMRDSEIAYHIGVHLEKLHIDFDIPQTISVAQMASKIFKRHFVQQPILLPDRPILEASIYAYHGGKNGITVPPGYYKDVSSLDISSAYPDAMHELPSFYFPDLYQYYRASSPDWVPDTGIYYVWGEVKPCPWPILYTHAFKPLRGGYIEKVAVTGFELNEAIRSKEFEPSHVEGWFYAADLDEEEPPMRAYVEDFYRRKEVETDPPRRYMMKTLLNALYGKYIQTRQKNRNQVFDVAVYDLVEIGDLQAGGMFQPFIAALITGHTRAKMHRMEHKYKALHTATDGIFTQISHAKLPNEKGLGALVTEAQGDLLLLRNKCYILYNDEPLGKAAIPSKAMPGRYIIKYAKHGFQGDVYLLEWLAFTGERKYKLSKRNSLRDAENRGRTVNKWEEREFTLDVPPLVNMPKVPWYPMPVKEEA